MCIRDSYLIGDSATQTLLEERESLDWHRFATFGAFGFIIGGGPLYYCHGVVIPRLVKNMTSNVAKCATFIAVDMGAFMPFVYFPTFYSVQQSIHMQGAEHQEPPTLTDMSRAAYTKWSQNVFSDLQYASTVMIPQDIALQMWVPPQWRVPFVSVSGLVWVAILSNRRGGEA
eukprot:TRINITY_DN10118_c0_g1_i1.p1 TRINITY_DN10118_c0_g1~~TRINITY_DN10118_c0_g1_i1.p1  ORF type:complete len:172 (-),score=27.23 TRINITY_DN10118_c0_g1_i1:229-744(-)